MRKKKLARLEIWAAELGQPGRVTVLAELTFLHLNSYPSGPTRIRTDNQSTSERFSACLSGLLERVTLFPWTTFSKNRRGLTKIWVAMNLTHTFLNLLTFQNAVSGKIRHFDSMQPFWKLLSSTWHLSSEACEDFQLSIGNCQVLKKPAVT